MRRPADAPKPDRAPVENDRAAKRNPGGWLAGYAPGHSLRIYEPGTAIKIPKGAIIERQLRPEGRGLPTRASTPR